MGVAEVKLHMFPVVLYTDVLRSFLKSSNPCLVYSVLNYHANTYASAVGIPSSVLC